MTGCTIATIDPDGSRVADARITSFLIKVASRCNLDCDYCYVYHHADQSWRKMPKTMSTEVRSAFAARLAEYAAETELKRAVIVFHGGEPLLAGVETIVGFANELRAAVGNNIFLDLAMQTNGLLLSQDALEALDAANISVSLSLDGGREANDRHRVSRKGRSSYNRVMEAYQRLQQHPKIFAGVISVIDPEVAPDEQFAFFDALNPPKLDFLLPDAHHLRPPPGRQDRANLYQEWLIKAFDLWFDVYPHLPVRTFEALLDVAAGLPSATDAFGFGDVNLLSVETDGSYHDLDVLKITTDGATALPGSVRDAAISAVAMSSGIEKHRGLLRKEGLSSKCLGCTVVDICGGGSVPHRFGENGFDNPSVYCNELFSLISHVKKRLADGLSLDESSLSSRLPDGFDLLRFEIAETADPAMTLLLEDARKDYAIEFRSALQNAFSLGEPLAATARRLAELPSTEFESIACRPSTVAWTRAFMARTRGFSVHDVEGKPLIADGRYLILLENHPDYFKVNGLEIAADDFWLRAPFGEQIHFEPESVASDARGLVNEALEIVRRWRPALAAEIASSCQAVQFVRDPTAHPDKIVSFSDDSVPGALFVSVTQGDALIDPYDLADSLIHEHRHQKLYLLERFGPTVSPSAPRVVSPWRADLRPPSGLLHAVFVFVELKRFWEHVRDTGPARMHNRALNQLGDTERNIKLGISTLRTCQMTPVGDALIDVLEKAGAQSLVGA
jgi:uncharacterized protein